MATTIGKQGVTARPVSLAGLTGLVMTVAGLFIGLQPLRDNSFLTHLATGRLILDHGVPTADPYSWTAHGAPWTVQSWLASSAYALAESVGGLAGIRVLIALASALLAWLLWRLTEPAGALVARVGLLLPVLVIGAGQWSERPLLFGLVGLAAVLLLADGHGRAWLAAPILWLWVNAHGSFPLAVVALLALVVGRFLDGDRPDRELRVLGWAALGVFLGAINPVGPRLLVFPAELLSKAEALHFIKEWGRPDPTQLRTQVFALLALGAGAAMLRRRSWRALLPSIAFALMALVSARNIAPASIVLLACAAPSLRGIGSAAGREPSRVAGLAAAAVAALAVVAGLGSLAGSDTDLRGYPEAAVTWMEDQGLLDPGQRVVSRDFAGNYLEARYGTDVRVFLDDRYDMYPLPVIEDYELLLRHPEDGWEDLLERYGATAVLWDAETDLAPLLEASSRWDVAYRDGQWLVAVPS